MPDYRTPAECVILAFGGVRRTAKALSRQPGAVIQWRKRGLVPNSLHAVILNLAMSGVIRITAEILILGDPPNTGIKPVGCAEPTTDESH